MTPQDEKELLLRLVTQLASKLIAEGGFVPFGATLGPGKRMNVLMPKSWKKNATRDELEAYWSRELKKAVTESGSITACSCADVRIPMDGGEWKPCILIHIEQAHSGAEDIGYPYVKNADSTVKLGSPTSVETGSCIFTENTQ